MPSGWQRATQCESTVQTNALGHDRLAQGSPQALLAPASGKVAQPKIVRLIVKQTATQTVTRSVFIAPTVASARRPCQCRRAQR